MLEDTLLIWRFKRGSNDALQRIYLKYKDDLLGLAVALTNDVSLAEDAVHDVFLRFAQSADTIRPKGSLKSLLVTSLVNRLRNRRRDDQRHEASGLDGSERTESELKRPEQWAILNEQLRLLAGALAQIPDEQREVLVLYMQGGLTFREIAKMHDLSINTIQGRYRYGLEKLRSVLNGEAQA